MKRLAAVAALCTLALLCSAQAQTPSPQARRDDLAKVQEMLSDPDPLMRLANMEAIVAAGDGLKTMLAIRSAFASDDADLRGLGLRAYLANEKEMTFDITLPASVQKAFDNAGSNMKDLERQYPYVQTLAAAAFRFKVRIGEYTLGQAKGKLANYGEPTFTIAGDKLTTRMAVEHIGECYVDFRPGKAQNLEGTLACLNGWPRLAISASAF